jgi:hypothetical protein
MRWSSMRSIQLIFWSALMVGAGGGFGGALAQPAAIDANAVKARTVLNCMSAN